MGLMALGEEADRNNPATSVADRARVHTRTSLRDKVETAAEDDVPARKRVEGGVAAEAARAKMPLATSAPSTYTRVVTPSWVAVTWVQTLFGVDDGAQTPVTAAAPKNMPKRLERAMSET